MTKLLPQWIAPEVLMSGLILTARIEQMALNVGLEAFQAHPRCDTARITKLRPSLQHGAARRSSTAYIPLADTQPAKMVLVLAPLILAGFVFRSNNHPRLSSS
ncbi:hypothetical protein [Vibrio coralliilyticus]|uniref:hypothetical protein n=1 Tax=Vibrio TaxID=662 RepID=UPI003F513718